MRKIGRITPAGRITEFSAGLGSHDVLNDIADGHDGGLWFTVAGSVPRIGRIDGDGRLAPIRTSQAVSRARPASSRPRPTAGSTSPTPPLPERSGASRRRRDRELSRRADRRVRPGRPSPRAATAHCGSPRARTSGGSAACGRQTVRDHRVRGRRHAGLRSGAMPAGITRGPDGNVWFTERAHPGRIGRVTVPPLADLEIEQVPRSSSGAAGVLQATIAANSQPTTYSIEYGHDESYGMRTDVRSAGSGAAPVERVVELPLTPGTPYHARIVASNDSGQTVSDDVELWAVGRERRSRSRLAAPGRRHPHRRRRRAARRRGPRHRRRPAPGTPDARRPPRRRSARPSSSARSAARSASRYAARPATGPSAPACTCRSARSSTRATAASPSRVPATAGAARRRARSGAVSSRSARPATTAA